MTRGERNCAWIESHLVVPEGRLIGQPVKLLPDQREFFCRIYDNPAGTRRAIDSKGRKNGKTAEAAFIVLLHLVGPEAQRNSSLYSAAQSLDQAAVLYNLAAKMVLAAPDIAAYVRLRENRKELICRELGTTYKALSADAKTKFGLSPALIVHDELGQVKGPRSPLYEALETATAAQSSPLSVVISTQAPTDADLLSILIDDAKTGADPRVVLSLHTAPVEMDPFSIEAIRLANPSLGILQNEQEVLAMAQDARRMPAREAEYRNLVLNQRVETNAPFVSRAVWEACAGTLTDWKGLNVYLGFDLSEVNDLTARVAVAFNGKIWEVRADFWLPEEGIKERSRRDRVPYDKWAAAGHIQLVPGKTVSYKHVAADTAAYIKLNKFAHAGFDRWNWRHFRPWLVKAGVPEGVLEKRFHDFGMGEASMTPALRTLEEDLLDAKIVHDRNPVLTMCMANATVKATATGSRKLDKATSRGRIDGAVALAIARGTAAEYDKASKAGIKLI